MLKRPAYARDQKLLNFLAKRVKELRLEHGFTQEELANDADIAIAQLKRIESGTVNTSVSSLYRISKALKVKFETLMDGVNKI